MRSMPSMTDTFIYWHKLDLLMEDLLECLFSRYVGTRLS